VDSTRENWNYIFTDLITLNDRLEQLGINAVDHDSDELKSLLLLNPLINTTINYIESQANNWGNPEQQSTN